MTETPTKTLSLSSAGRFVERLRTYQDYGLDIETISLMGVEERVPGRSAMLHSGSCERIWVGKPNATQREISVSELWEAELSRNICFTCSGRYLVAGTRDKMGKPLEAKAFIRLLRDLQAVVDVHAPVDTLEDIEKAMAIHENAVARLEEAARNECLNGLTSRTRASLSAYEKSYQDALRSDGARMQLRHQAATQVTVQNTFPPEIAGSEALKEVRDVYAATHKLQVEALATLEVYVITTLPDLRYTRDENKGRLMVEARRGRGRMIAFPVAVYEMFARMSYRPQEAIVVSTQPLPEHMEALEVFYSGDRGSTLNLQEAYDAACAV